MKTVSKKLLSVLLVAILLVSAIPFQAFAENPPAEPAAAPVAEPVAEAVVDPATTTAPETTPETVTTTAPETTATTVPVENTPPVTATVPNAQGVTTEPHNENLPSHVSGVWTTSPTQHWHLCPNPDCAEYNVPLNVGTHSFNAFGRCVVCDYACLHNGGTRVEGNVAATCVKEGSTGDTICSLCGAVIQKATDIPATGVHNYVNYKCTVCGKSEDPNNIPNVTITLDANGGTINGGTVMQVQCKDQGPLNALPDPTRPGYTFVGWFTSPIGGTQVSFGAICDGSFTTLYARWTEVTYRLTVLRLLNGVYSTAKEIETVNVPAGTPLLAYLNNNVTPKIQQELNITPGFTWQFSFWRDYSGNQQLTSQSDVMNQAQTIYVNFVSNSYNLYFNADGGTVTPTSKPVYFGSAVGTLPVATKNGKVFQGWKDSNGTMYTAGTIYQVDGDTTLTAVWKDEALVILYIYINGDFSACDRMVVMDGFVKNNNISRSDVYREVANHYVPASGYLNIAGLFNEYTWGSYRTNTSKPGVENIQIDSSRVNKIYVMVTNARTGSTVITNPGGTITVPGGGSITIPQNSYWVATGSNTGYWVQGTAPQGSYWVSTGNGNGYWVYPAAGTNPGTIVYPTWVYPGTNPKTGDTSMIEAAAAVMVLAAAALVTIMSLRKRKMAK